MRSDLSGGIRPVSTRVMNLSHFLTDIARRHPDAPGFIWGDTTWSWAQIETRAAAFAEVLIDRFKVRKGDRILVQSANNNQMFEAMFGCWRAGCVWVPANFRQTPDDVAFLAQSSEARGMLVGAEFAKEALQRMIVRKIVAVVRTAEIEGRVVIDLAGARLHPDGDDGRRHGGDHVGEAGQLLRLDLDRFGEGLADRRHAGDGHRHGGAGDGAGLEERGDGSKPAGHVIFPSLGPGRAAR